MGWWFGRKSAPADARPFVPAWLQDCSQEEGFARSQEGLTAFVKSTGSWACYRSANWEIGQLRGSTVVLDGVQVVGPRLSEIAEPTGGDVIDAEGRAAIGQILAALRGHGLIES